MTGPLNTSQKRFSAFQRSRVDTSSPTAAAEVPRRRADYARRYGNLLRPHFKSLAWLLALSVLGIGIDMVWPLVSAHLIDQVILSKELSTERKVTELVGYSLGMAGLLLVGAGLGWARALGLQLLNSQLAFQLRASLFQRVLRLPMNELTDMKTGGILSRLSGDVDSTTGLLQQALLSPLLAGLRLLITLFIIFS